MLFRIVASLIVIACILLAVVVSGGSSAPEQDVQSQPVAPQGNKNFNF